MRLGIAICSIFSAFTALTGCSKTNDYTPSTGMTGEEVFMAACFDCHKTDGGKIFLLDKEKASTGYVKQKLQSGSMMMPAFPNIRGGELEGLAQYVIDNSSVK